MLAFGVGALRKPVELLGSRNITGSGSSAALTRRPFTSAGVDGTTTFRPGTCVYNASMDWE